MTISSIPAQARLIFMVVLALSHPGFAASQEREMWFEDVTASAFGGIPIERSFGAGAWGDFDGDGDADLFLGNHADRSSLWQNNGDGTFTDVASVLMPPHERGDTHGAAWADFDGDGDLDLIEAVGGKLGAGDGPNRLWRNDYPAPFVDVAAAVGIDDPNGRSRTPLWFDWNYDGRLDLLVTAFVSATSDDRLFTQTAQGTFVLEGPESGFVGVGSTSRSAQVGDFDADGKPELVLMSVSFPSRAYEFGPDGFVPENGLGGVGALPRTVDFVADDLDGDRDLDFYFARDSYWEKSEAVVGPDGALRLSQQSQRGRTFIRFESIGDILLDLGGAEIVGDAFLGAAKIPADSFRIRFNDPRTIGVPELTPVSRPTFYICRESDSATWLLIYNTPVPTEFTLEVTPTGVITDLQTSVVPSLNLPDAQLFADKNPGYVYPSFGTSGRSVVSGDFDNDGDLDLYVVRSGEAQNQPNRLWENLGKREFRNVAEVALAEGPSLGIGDGVSVADYDGDGFLDLLLTNGAGLPPLNDDGQVMLLRNRTNNGHHWLQIDLRGTASNPEGIGARVIVTTANRVQQRDQRGGIHVSTQNHPRLHFGLAEDDIVQKIAVVWPSGKQSVLTNVPADQRITIVE